MDKPNLTNRHGLLLLGDVLTLALVTFFGFASHDATSSPFSRMLATFLPLVAAWLLISPHLQVFNLEKVQEPRQLWRPFWSMVLAAPLAGFLRGVWLGTAVLPVFIVVIGGVSALAILVWRGIFSLWLSQRVQTHG